MTKPYSVGGTPSDLAERGRRIVVERKWLSELARALGARPLELESVVAVRERLLAVAQGRAERAALPLAGEPASVPEGRSDGEAAPGRTGLGRREEGG
jgi:hypothetical protein